MKRLILISIVTVSLALIAWAGFQATAPASNPALASVMPQGALVYIEAKDLGGLLRQWDASPEKSAWMKSDNYEVFSRSRLLLRLQQAQEQFAAAAGIPPNYGFLNEVAGDQSALGIYDIGKLELLYVTHTSSGNATKSQIWQQRSKFEPRQANGNTFYVRKDAESGKVVALATFGDYLILATREDLAAGALAMLSGQKMTTLEQQPWFASAMKSARAPGDLRLLVHLADVVKTPHFRTYWVQQNITDLGAYESSIADLRLQSNEYREERTLVPKSVDSMAADSDDALETGRLASIVPPDMGVFRATASPNAEQVLATLEQTVLTPRLGPAPPEKIAPGVHLGEGTVGSQSDLERRIDVAPSQGTDGAKSDEPLRLLLAANHIRSIAQAHRSERASDGVFIRLQTAVIVSSSTAWDEAAVLKAVKAAVSPGLSAGELGMEWTKVGSGNQGYWKLSGLNPITVAVRDKLLMVASDSGIMNIVAARLDQRTPATPAVYVARFRHDIERDNFYKMTNLLDRASGGNFTGQSERQPQFFSQNVGSLSRAFSGVKSETVTITREGGLEHQLVRYEWGR